MTTEKECFETNQSREAHNLREVIEAIQEFSNETLVWYRGHESYDHQLLPTLYRNKTVNFISDDDYSYNSIHMAEQMRIQQYYARDYPFIKDSGNNTVEWLGMGQHFGMNTRFLDWSLSAIHSIMFALGKYVEDPEYKGGEIPCLWVLKPQKMNQMITDRVLFSKNCYEAFTKRYLQDPRELDALNALEASIKKIPDEFRKVFIESNPENKWQHMDYIYNISYFDRLLAMVKHNPRMAFTGNVINPLFLFLSMIYIDGTKIEDEAVRRTPLAVIHPLNSERIREQKGVFTVFPFPNKTDYANAQDSLEYMRMERNPYLKGSLCKIALLHPRKICNELKTLGVHRSWLFNEPEYITKEIESGL